MKLMCVRAISVVRRAAHHFPRVRGPVLSFCSTGLNPLGVRALGGFFLGVVVCHASSFVSRWQKAYRTITKSKFNFVVVRKALFGGDLWTV